MTAFPRMAHLLNFGTGEASCLSAALSPSLLFPPIKGGNKSSLYGEVLFPIFFSLEGAAS